MEEKFKIYIGSSSDNKYPNYSGWAYTITFDDKIVNQDTGSTQHETNNRMCLSAIILAMEKLDVGSSAIVFTNSQYCITVLTQSLKPNAKNLDLLELYHEILQKNNLDIEFVFCQTELSMMMSKTQHKAIESKNKLQQKELNALPKAIDRPFDFVIYTDGASNPSTFDESCYGGWGYVVLNNNKIVSSLSGGDIHTTNNRMELTAILQAVKAIPKGSHVQVNTDSQYCIQVLSTKKNRVNNSDIITSFFNYIEAMDISVVFQWVRGHNGNKWNEYVDKMANGEYEKISGRQIIDFKRLYADKGYNKKVFQEYYNNNGER